MKFETQGSSWYRAEAYAIGVGQFVYKVDYIQPDGKRYCAFEFINSK